MSIFGEARWVTASVSCESPQFSREFVLDEFDRAKINICGLGYFELFLNGVKVGDDRFTPLWSDYEKRDLSRLLYPLRDEFSHRIYYVEQDVTDYLRPGKNCIGIWLGNGWYRQTERLAEGHLSYGDLKLCFNLGWEKEEQILGSLTSDEQMHWRPSEIVRNNIYYGETHDLSRVQKDWALAGADRSLWQRVQVAAAPESRFTKQDCPADRVIRRIQPKLLQERRGSRIYDCGENISGIVELSVKAGINHAVSVRHSEVYCEETKELDFRSAGGDSQIQTDRYYFSSQESAGGASGLPAELAVSPRFCWHGFRYFEVEGEADVIAISVLHMPLETTVTFECSDPTLNWIFQSYIRTQLANCHGGVPSDCPHRERLGYTGDGQLTAEAALLCLESKELYVKWLRDIADGQDPTSGHVQHTAPFYGGGGGPGGWGCAIWQVPWQLYRRHGDIGILREYLPNMLLWLDYMDSRSEGGLVVREEEGGWCLGEWCAPDLKIPPEFVNTYFYIKGLKTVRQIADILGEEIDQRKLRQRISQAKNTLIQRYYDRETGSFCEGVNGADAFALDLELGDSRTARNLIRRYETSTSFDTGIFGTDILIDQLFRMEEAALAFKLLTNQTVHSFESMRKVGSSTLWETWDGGASHSHPMFGAVVRSFLNHILGIHQREGSAGYRDIEIKPVHIPQLSWVKGSLRIPEGIVHVEIDAAGHVTSHIEKRESSPAKLSSNLP